MEIKPGEGDDAEADDWVELEPTARAAGKMPDVTVRVSPPSAPSADAKKRGGSRHARVWVVFREGAAEWIETHNRFRLEIGGPFANKMRVTPDNERGRYETGILKGVSRMFIGEVNAWPPEARDATAATWEIRGGSMVLTLPADWARARTPRLPPPTAVAVAPQKPAAAPLGPGLIGRRGV